MTATEPPAGNPGKTARAVPYSTIRRERVEWLVPGRVPLGAVSMLAGEPGLGKSMYSVRLAADLSHRGIASLLLSAEDSEGATIRPRLDACEAVSGLVHAVSLAAADGMGEGLSFPRDAGELDRLIVETRAKLVVIDPVVAHLDSGIDSHKDASVRQALAPLARIAADRSCAVLAVLHVNKALGSDWYRRLSGSGGFGGAARSVLLFGRDPDDEDADTGARRLLAHAKCNVAELAASERWVVVPIVLPANADEPEARTARLELVGASEHGYRTLLSSGGEPDETGASDDAESFLRIELATGSKRSQELRRQAQNAGISERTLQRAKKRLGVKASKQGFGEGAYWAWAFSDDTKVANAFADDDSEREWQPSHEASTDGGSTGSGSLQAREDGHVSKVAPFAPATLAEYAEIVRLRRKFPELAGEEA